MQKSFNNNPSRREQRLRLGQGFDNNSVQFRRKARREAKIEILWSTKIITNDNLFQTRAAARNARRRSRSRGQDKRRCRNSRQDGLVSWIFYLCIITHTCLKDNLTWQIKRRHTNTNALKLHSQRQAEGLELVAGWIGELDVDANTHTRTD